MKTFTRSLLFFITCFILVLSCGKSDEYVPTVGVYIRVSLNNPIMSDLNNPGGTVVFRKYGVAGVVICRRSSLRDDYVAFDLCSTFNPGKKCTVEVDGAGFLATDPCSGAKYSLTDGMAMKGPASKPLKRYQVFVDSYMITVTN